MKFSLILISLFIHVTSIGMVGYVFNQLNHKSNSIETPYVELSIGDSDESYVFDDTVFHSPDAVRHSIPDKIVNSKNEKNIQKKTTITLYRRNISNNSLDTNSLVNIYSDPDKFISLKYPAGWNFLDHSNSDELVGVTFWNTKAHSSPPPFIHIKGTVKNKFSAGKFLHKIEFYDFTAFYNKPVSHHRQLIQEIYLKTKIGIDFRIELVVKSLQEYELIQPKFFGMIETIKFGEIIL